ncbi:MAG: nucleoside deaminase [Alphaproteobacteria bacterium]
MSGINPQDRATRFLDVIENDIVPLTRSGVETGNKLFGAAILKKSDLSLVVAATNREVENPLYHGEISTLNDYYALPERPTATDCLFLSTHEPCPLCLSAITWAGFDNFTYLFGYEATRDAFAIPHDLKILDEVFGCKDGAYRRKNAFWTATALADLAGDCTEPERSALRARIDNLSDIYAQMSETYQENKGDSAIPLA